MPATCFSCGEVGHVQRECPNEAYLQGTGSDWCGKCDQRTRLIALNEEQDRVQRCRDCHPAGRQQHPQFRHCTGCGQVVYTWDGAGCDRHAKVGVRRPHAEIERKRPERAMHSQDLALLQVAESRMARFVT